MSRGRDLEKVSIGVAIFWLVFIVVMITGWAMNLVAIFSMGFDTWTPLLVVRLVGLFILPLGTGMGFFA